MLKIIRRAERLSGIVIYYTACIFTRLRQVHIIHTCTCMYPIIDVLHSTGMPCMYMYIEEQLPQLNTPLIRHDFLSFVCVCLIVRYCLSGRTLLNESWPRSWPPRSTTTWGRSTSH